MAEIIHAFGGGAGSEDYQNREAVRLLENTLELVKSGEVVNVGIVLVRGDGALNTAWSGGSSRWRLMAGCDFLKRDLMDFIKDS